MTLYEPNTILEDLLDLTYEAQKLRAVSNLRLADFQLGAIRYINHLERDHKHQPAILKAARNLRALFES